MSALSRQPWIHSPALDLGLILSPAVLVSLSVLLFHQWYVSFQNVPLWAWGLLIVGIDVAHVYSTLFRTYLDRVEFGRQKTLLTVIPLACWLVGVLLYSIDALLFWRVLAYVAVFHFVRQQYGFMAIYARNEDAEYGIFRWLDSLLIYLSMLFPIVYWHTHLPRNFNWFVTGDFMQGLPAGLEIMAGGLFALVALIYLVKEIRQGVKNSFFNLPKNLLILGTALSWNLGILLFNHDLIFTATNVISHGIPYMALIWIYGRKAARQSAESVATSRAHRLHFFSLAFVPLFVLFLWVLAFVEEGLWDGFVWREHPGFFGFFAHLPAVTDSQTLSWLVPLLTLPQATHYVLDGFIWRMRKPEASQWTGLLFQPVRFRQEADIPA